MTFLNSSANIKQFQLIRFINENSDDDHVVSKISIVLRRDKIEAPYYMDSKIRLSTCIDRQENGMVHAMDLLNHNRMHNLTEEKFNEIEELIENSLEENPQVKVFREDKRLKLILTARGIDQTEYLFEKYGELFDVIDNLIS